MRPERFQTAGYSVNKGGLVDLLPLGLQALSEQCAARRLRSASAQSAEAVTGVARPTAFWEEQGGTGRAPDGLVMCSTCGTGPKGERSDKPPQGANGRGQTGTVVADDRRWHCRSNPAGVKTRRAATDTVSTALGRCANGVERCAS